MKKRLNNGVEIPILGLGVYQLPSGEATKNTILEALKLGYRHIDTAKIYRNEADVGAAIKASPIPRSEIFVTTKLWNSDHGYQRTLQACEESLERLQLDYLDLYLIHWPVEGKRLESWRAMETLLKEGKCRAIGVSNYMVRHLEELLEVCQIIPAVNQIELSPYNYRYLQPVVDYCRAREIALVAYSPLTKGQKLNDPVLRRIAREYHKSPAQVLLRWAIQHDFIVIPKASRIAHLQENMEIFDFTLSEDHMNVLDGLNENLITGWDPTHAP
ncbi:MAG: aldo/keto reductase [Calditrichia bacterium]